MTRLFLLSLLKNLQGLFQPLKPTACKTKAVMLELVSKTWACWSVPGKPGAFLRCKGLTGVTHRSSYKFGLYPARPKLQKQKCTCLNKLLPSSPVQDELCCSGGGQGLNSKFKPTQVSFRFSTSSGGP